MATTGNTWINRGCQVAGIRPLQNTAHILAPSSSSGISSRVNGLAIRKFMHKSLKWLVFF